MLRLEEGKLISVWEEGTVLKFESISSGKRLLIFLLFFLFVCENGMSETLFPSMDELYVELRKTPGGEYLQDSFPSADQRWGKIREQVLVYLQSGEAGIQGNFLAFAEKIPLLSTGSYGGTLYTARGMYSIEIIERKKVRIREALWGEEEREKILHCMKELKSARSSCEISMTGKGVMFLTFQDQNGSRSILTYRTQIESQDFDLIPGDYAARTRPIHILRSQTAPAMLRAREKRTFLLQ